jgi:uncharacterized protein YegP (UPF0339 family)
MWFDVRKTRLGEYWWRAVASNGEPLGHSEMYRRKADCQHAVNILKREAASATVYDETGEHSYSRS